MMVVLFLALVACCLLSEIVLSAREENNYSWISYCSNENITDENNTEIYVTHACPYDYCISPGEDVYINFSDVSSQCAFNRRGILCGSCKDGFSTILGSSACWENCSNLKLALVLPFALAGIALVVFILVCNLTVAVGTINGLIFYANVLITNRATFFPLRRPTILSRVIIAFVSWLNLDLGIETCFYDGMTGYVKTWLQFAFPVYILFLVILIIILARYFQCFTRLLSGKNPVATLATLILLSYAKFLRTIVIIVSFADMSCYDKVWLYDGNVPYWDIWHICLFVAAIIIILIGVIYTVVLFLSRWVMRCPNQNCLYVTTLELNGFLETYSAPYKTNHHYWTGLLLLARIVLYTVSATFSHKEEVSLFAIIVIVTGLVFWKVIAGRVYKQWILEVLETSFLVNLIVLACATIAKMNGLMQLVIAYASVSIASFTFAIIVIFHTYKYIILRWTFLKKRIGRFSRQNQLEPSYNPEYAERQSDDDHAPLVTRTIVEISQRHTPLAKRLGHDNTPNYHTIRNRHEPAQGNHDFEENTM